MSIDFLNLHVLREDRRVVDALHPQLLPFDLSATAPPAGQGTEQ